MMGEGPRPRFVSDFLLFGTFAISFDLSVQEKGVSHDRQSHHRPALAKMSTLRALSLRFSSIQSVVTSRSWSLYPDGIAIFPYFLFSCSFFRYELSPLVILPAQTHKNLKKSQTHVTKKKKEKSTVHWLKKS